MIEGLVKKIVSLNWLFYFMVVLTIIFVFKNADISIMLFAAMVFACSLNPIVDKLANKMSRPVAALIVLVSSLLLLALIFIPLILSCVYEISNFASDFPTYISNLNNAASSNPIVHKLGLTKIDWNGIYTSLVSMSSNIFDSAIEFFQNVSAIFLYVFLTIIFIFYLMADKENIKKATIKLFPSNIKDSASNIIDMIGVRLGGYLIAQCCAIVSVGAVMLIGLLIFKVPYAPLLALITAILDIIPVVGPAIALVICLVSVYTAGILPIVVVIVTFALAQLIENNFVRPYAFGKLLNIHPMLIFIFLFVATKYLGVIGTLFAPAIAATVCVLVDELYIKNLK